MIHDRSLDQNKGMKSAGRGQYLSKDFFFHFLISFKLMNLLWIYKTKIHKHMLPHQKIFYGFVIFNRFLSLF